MALLGLTRVKIRQAVLRNLLGSALITGSPTTLNSNSVFIDTSLFGGNKDYNGHWIWWTAGNNLNSESRVNAHASSNDQLTLEQATSGNIALTDTYELWPPEYRPSVINDFINDAIYSAVGRGYDPQESLALFADRNTRRFDIPSEFDILQRIYYRNSVAAKKVHSVGSDWDETTQANVTRSLDTEDKKRGLQSLKLVTAAGLAANDVMASDSITSIDLSAMTHAEFWMKATIGIAAGELRLLLHSATVVDATFSNNLENLAVPVLAADIWTYCRVALANPETDTAIVSVGLGYATDSNEVNTFWIDDIKTVTHDTADWLELPTRLWRVDREQRDLILTAEAKGRMGYALMKLKGGQDPAAIATDAALPVIDENYIIAYATALAAGGGSRRTDADPSGRRSTSAFWYAKAREFKRNMPPLINARRV